MMRSQQAETDKKLYKQAEMESELKQLRRELLELKKSIEEIIGKGGTIIPPYLFDLTF